MRFVLLLILLIVSVPTIAGYLFTPPNWKWTGIGTLNTGDLNGYLSMIEEIRQNGPLARNLFTAEPQPRFQIRPVWALLAYTAKIFPPASSLLLLQIGQLLGSFCLLLVLRKLISQFFEKDSEKILTILVICFGSGVGWAQLVHFPPDLYIVETSAFLALISPPLYTISLSLLFGIIFTQYRAWTEADSRTGWQFAAAGGLCALWLGFDRPFGLFPLALAFTAALFIEGLQLRRFPGRQFLYLTPLAIGALISLGYQIVAIRTIPVYAEWNRQHFLRTPDTARLITAFGFLIPLAIFGIKPLIRKNRILAVFVICYVIASLICSHLPLQFQERFLEGLPVCIGLMAGCGVMTLLSGIRHSAARVAVGTVVLLILSVSSYKVLSQDFEILASQSPPQYLPVQFLEGLKRLNNLASPNDAIFSTQGTGNFIPAYSGRPVVLGHPVQTARLQEKQALVWKLFHTAANQPEAATLFHTSRANWLVWGPDERKLSEGIFNPDLAPFLEKKFSNSVVALYRLRNQN